MGLFTFEPGPPAGARGDRIATPLGELTTRVRIGAFDSAAAAPSQILGTTGGGSVTVWEAPDFRAELLRASVMPGVPPGVLVESFQVALWRIRAAQEGCAPSFECLWSEISDDADGGPDSGQYLAAQTWNADSGTVTLGTDDFDYLVEWSSEFGELPARIARLLDHTTVEFLPAGFKIVLPPLREGEQCQLKFAAAYTPKELDDEYGTWCAVKMSARRILEEVGVQ